MHVRACLRATRVCVYLCVYVCACVPFSQQGNVMLRTPPQSVPIDSDATMSMDSGASAKVE